MSSERWKNRRAVRSHSAVVEQPNQRALAVARGVEWKTQAPRRDAIEDYRAHALRMRPHVDERRARAGPIHPRDSAACSRVQPGSRRGPPSPDHSRSSEGRRRATQGTPGSLSLHAPGQACRCSTRRHCTGALRQSSAAFDRRVGCRDAVESERRRTQSTARMTTRPVLAHRRAGRADRVQPRGPGRHDRNVNGNSSVRGAGPGLRDRNAGALDLFWKAVDPARSQSDARLRPV